MTQDEIIKLAIENTIYGLKFDEEGLLRFAKLVAQHEREACANAISKIQMTPTLTHGVLVKLPDVVNAIRARGQA